MDKRKLNGGNSTKAKGLDKRKNKYLQLLDDASTEEEIIKVIKTLKKEALNGELPAIKLFLEYYLGKPKESIEINDITDIKPNTILNFKDYGDKQ
tara:strand:+ start:369 stop:653 length:285 start_codon:yes stop_codon:yes gene_type:complete